MKKIFTLVTMAFTGLAGMAQDKPASSFNPTIKVKGLIHARFEQSLTDSIDVQGKFNEDPVKSNFRLRRVEIRTDIKLNDHWSGVIRVQLPELKSPGTTYGRVIELAYFEYKYKDQLSLRGGQLKTPFELDELTSHEDLRMIDRGSTSRMFVNNYYSSYQPGIMVFGTFLKEKTPLSYYLGVFNGSDRALNYDNNSGKNLVGRVEFSPIKSLRLGLNGQVAPISKSVAGNALGGDVSLQQKLSEKLNLILEGEYIAGSNILSYDASADTIKDLKDFTMNGYFGQALLRIAIKKPGLQTFEVGGRFESTNPLKTNDNDEYTTITWRSGVYFSPG
jgi:hypothetical protein